MGAVGQQIEHWRQTRTKRSPMPERLWRAAVELAGEHGVFGASQALGVSYDSLRKRAEAAGVARRRAKKGEPLTATFVELAPPAFPMGIAHSGPVIEVTGPRGQRLTMRLRGDELDLAALIRECWRA
jgi:hypothetical protein